MACPLNLAVAVIVIAVVAYDAANEWQARRAHAGLVSAWPMQRVQAVELALETLKKAGIPAFARGFGHRMMLQVFGPFVPVDILVRREHRDEAQRRLATLLAPESGVLVSTNGETE